MWSKLKEQWHAEESKLGKVLKNWVPHISIIVALATEGLTQLSAAYTTVSLPVPEFIPHGLVGLATVSWIIGKFSKASIASPSNN